MQITETQRKFLGSLGTPKTTEINNLKTIISELNTTENIYFCSGGASDKRNHDHDIWRKKYFVIDLDIRKWFEKAYENDPVVRRPVITDEEIKDIGNIFIDYGKRRGGFFSEWRWVVFSGNGLHLYFVGDEYTMNPDPLLYKMGVTEIFKKFEIEFMGEYMTPDPVCCNLARVMRLPGTINQKTGKECEIMAYQEVSSSLVSQIMDLGKKAKEDIKRKKDEENEKIRKKYEVQSRMQELIDGKKKDLSGFLLKKEIIDSIPIHLISEILIPQFPLSRNQRNFDNEKHGYTAYFISDKHDNTICNGGSVHYAWGDSDSCYTPSLLVKNFYDLSWGETIEWFESHFSNFFSNGK